MRIMPEHTRTPSLGLDAGHAFVNDPREARPGKTGAAPRDMKSTTQEALP
jgi:hypothetical protein